MSEVLPGLPKMAHSRIEARQRASGTKALPTSRHEEPPVFLPVPPALTFVSEGNSKPTSRSSNKAKGKSPSYSSNAAGPGTALTSVVELQGIEKSKFDTNHSNYPVDTATASTTYTSGSSTPKAKDSCLSSTAPDKPQQPCYQSQSPRTRPSNKYRRQRELYTTDVLEEFTWINEIYNEDVESTNLLSPFSSNTSVSNDVDHISGWDSSTDASGVSGITTPFTDDGSSCWTPL